MATRVWCRARRVASVPLLLYGCVAQQPVVLDDEVSAPRGHSAAKPGRPGFVIAAPHDSSETRTGEIAAELARRTGFGLVVASAGAGYEKRVQEAAQGRLLFY